MKKDALTKHVATVDHRAVIEAKKCRKDMQQAFTNVYRDQVLAIISALKAVYFMAKKKFTKWSFLWSEALLNMQGCW